MSWTGKNDLKTLCVDADFCENERKKFLFSKKNPDTCGWDLAINDRVQLSFVFFFN